MFGRLGVVEALLVLMVGLLGVVIWWRIFSKTGYSGWLGLLVFVPLANVIVLLVLAFTTWPIEKEIQRLREAR